MAPSEAPRPCPPAQGLDIRAAQRLAWHNKIDKGFNTTDVPLEFCLLQGEMAEAFDAWRKDGPDVAAELADVAIYLLGLAELLGIDLQDAVGAKLAANAVRTYQPLPNGVLVKSAPRVNPDDSASGVKPGDPPAPGTPPDGPPARESGTGSPGAVRARPPVPARRAPGGRR